MTAADARVAGQLVQREEAFEALADAIAAADAVTLRLTGTARVKPGPGGWAARARLSDGTTRRARIEAASHEAALAKLFLALPAVTEWEVAGADAATAAAAGVMAGRAVTCSSEP